MNEHKQIHSQKKIKTDPVLLERCKQMYFAGLPIPTIARLNKVDSSELNELILGKGLKGTHPNCWYMVKQNTTDAITEYFITTKLESLENTWGLVLATLTEGTKNLYKEIKESSKPLSSKDIKNLADAMAQVHKMARLENGDPTEIMERAGLSAKEAREVLMSDPFAQGIIDITPKDNE